MESNHAIRNTLYTTWAFCWLKFPRWNYASSSTPVSVTLYSLHKGTSSTRLSARRASLRRCYRNSRWRWNSSSHANIPRAVTVKYMTDSYGNGSRSKDDDNRTILSHLYVRVNSGCTMKYTTNVASSEGCTTFGT